MKNMVTPSRNPKRNSALFKTPLPVHHNVNDDDLERSRISAASNSSVMDSATVAVVEKENEEIQQCLKFFNENKISRENAWSLPMIDVLATLSARHRKYMQNFSMVASSLEASAKIYGYRVDMVHEDVLRMMSGLSRFNNDNRRAEDDDVDENDQPVDQNGEPAAKRAPKPKRKRVAKSTIVKNLESINAPVETEPFIDPIFAQIKSHVGDAGSAVRVFNNILGSTNSFLNLKSDKPFWQDEESDFEEDETTILLEIPKMDKPIQIRPILHGYQINDKPGDIVAELYQDDEEMHSDHDYDDYEAPVVNSSQPNNPMLSELAFDMNADVEPIVFDEPRPHMQLDTLEQLDDCADEDIGNACRPIGNFHDLITTSMHPTESYRRPLEYSYRNLENIQKYWAGPSFWKIIPKKVRVTLDPNHKPDKRKRKVKLHEPPNPAIIDPSKFREFDIRQNNQLSMKTWDIKKLKLPTRYEVEDDAFAYFDPSILPLLGNEECLITSEESNAAAPLNTSGRNNLDGGGLEGQSEDILPSMMPNDDHQNYDDDDHQNYDDGMDNPENPGDCLAGSAPPQMDKTIGAIFELAPEKLEKIILPFATHAKVIDMKMLKHACWKSLNTIRENTVRDEARKLTENDTKYLQKVTAHLVQKENYEPGNSTFYETVANLPNLLSKKQEENLSIPLAFSAILHLANENNLRFIPVNSKDFKIVKVTP